MEKIAILTSGGDSPGMNAAIRAAVRQGIDLGMTTVGVKHGFKGLVEGDFQKFGIKDVSGIIERGGTILHSQRAPEFKRKEVRDEAIRTLNKEEIDGLIVIGGDGSLRGAYELHKENIPTIGIPATIDNDVSGTDIAIGVDTALNMVVEALDRIRDTATALERAFVVEVMGRESGYIALMGGFAGGAEEILVPEIDFDLEQVAQKIYEGYKRGKQHSIIVVAEGIHKEGSAAHFVGEQIKAKIGFEMRITVLGYMQRGGSPSAYDRTLSSRLGAEAAKQLYNNNSGLMMGMDGQDIKGVKFGKALQSPKKINKKIYDLAEVLAK